MVKSLLETGKHTITAITRADSTNTFPSDVTVKKVDYDNHASLVEALRGQDALIITMSVTAPKGQDHKLLEAAADADVPWIIPNEWGIDSLNEGLGRDTFLGEDKRKTRELIDSRGKSSWVGVTTGFWYEWSLAIKVAFGFDFDNRSVTFFDEGETPIGTSTWPQVGRTVAKLLSLKISPDGEGDDSLTLDKYKNDFIFVNSFTLTQKDMLDSALRVTGTTLDDWTITKQPVQERYAEGVKELQSGNRLGFGKLLYARDFYPDGCGDYEKTRGLMNKELGLPKEDLDEATKAAIARAKKLNGGY